MNALARKVWEEPALLTALAVAGAQVGLQNVRKRRLRAVLSAIVAVLGGGLTRQLVQPAYAGQPIDPAALEAESALPEDVDVTA